MQDGPRKGAILVSGGALRAGKLLRLGVTRACRRLYKPGSKFG